MSERIHLALSPRHSITPLQSVVSPSLPALILSTPTLPPDHSISGLDLWHWYTEAVQRAIAASVPAAELDWLLQGAGVDRLALRLGSVKERSQVTLTLPFAQLQEQWQHRLQHRVPVQYLVGSSHWRQFTLKVAPGVLIPRPETEEIIDLAVAATLDRPSLTQGIWVDLGTGSGAIAIGLADSFPAAAIHAVDTSVEALAIAQENAERLGFSSRIQFYQGSWFTPLAHLRGQLSGMVSNPPYIPSSMIATLQAEVARHEPHLALDGGSDGLEAIRHLVAIAPDYLQPGGLWLIEMMSGQATAVVELLHQHGHYGDISIHQDLAGIERFALAYRTV